MQLPIPVHVCLHPFLFRYKLPTKLPKILGPVRWSHTLYGSWATVHVLTDDARWVWVTPERLWADSMTRREQVKRGYNDLHSHSILFLSVQLDVGLNMPTIKISDIIHHRQILFVKLKFNKFLMNQALFLVAIQYQCLTLTPKRS